ncbi:MAG: phosphoribosylamine--glycine ligase [Planctomycetes bacterium]|nr:phosphoribosylamine--glycine ligase [Planctomycetota bacterium]
MAGSGRLKVFLIGSGGREHALADAILRSPRTERLYVAPGSDALAAVATRIKVAADDVAGIRKCARDLAIDLVVVGPEAPLVAGVADALTADGIAVFGPKKQAAQLEGSKVFTKNLLRKYHIPTAESRVFDDARHAELWFAEQQSQWPVVLKADGLAAGKGVVIAQDRAEALEAVERIMVRREFGDAGARLLVEECLIGEELSVMAITDGRTLLTLEPARDHKRVFDGDAGPNTGGMGAYSPTALWTPELEATVEARVLLPTLHALNREGIEYRGVLYAGLMLTADGPKVLEFNVRFGDPETQVILPRLATDFVDIAEKTAAGRLDELGSIEFRPDAALVVVLASEGYPGPCKTGRRIAGLGEAAAVPGVTVQHAGTRQELGHWLTQGGRVLGVTAVGGSLEEARHRAYEACDRIHFEGVHYRRDIGVVRDATRR